MISDQSLSQQIAEARYLDLEIEICGLLGEHGLRETMNQIMKASCSLPSGKERNVLLRLLGLGHIKGIDCDLTKLTHRLEAGSLEELREKVVPVAKKHLVDQAKRGNTFFIDVEYLATTPYAGLIDDILNSRGKQIRTLPKSARPTKVMATYYGFKILTRNQYHQTMSSEMRKIALQPFEKICSELGKTVNVKHKPIHYCESIWSYCPQPVREILLDLLRVYTTTCTTASRAYDTLVRLGDARVDAELVHFDKCVPNRIASPYAASRANRIRDQFHNRRKRIGPHDGMLIVGPELYKEQLGNGVPTDELLQKCEWDKVIGFLSSEGYISAVRTLLGAGQWGLEVLKNHREVVLKALSQYRESKLYKAAIPLFGQSMYDVDSAVIAYTGQHEGEVGSKYINQDEGEVMI